MVRRELVAAKAGRARAWLNDAATTLLAPLDVFAADAKLIAVTTAAGMSPEELRPC